MEAFYCVLVRFTPDTIFQCYRKAYLNKFQFSIILKNKRRKSFFFFFLSQFFTFSNIFFFCFILPHAFIFLSFFLVLWCNIISLNDVREIAQDFLVAMRPFLSNNLLCLFFRNSIYNILYQYPFENQSSPSFPLILITLDFFFSSFHSLPLSSRVAFWKEKRFTSSR